MGGQVSVEGVHVVVVGGGFGGIAAAQDLKYRGFSFTLIDMRDAFHHNVGALRASVQPGFAQKTFIPYAATFGESFVQGRVELVDTDRQAVILEGGREIRYSHLILCTGTDGPFPGKFNMVAPYHTAVQKYENFIGQSFKRQEYIVIEEFPESSEEECGDSGSDEDWMPEQKGASRVARSSSDSDEGDEAQEKNMRVRKKKVRHMRQKMRVRRKMRLRKLRIHHRPELRARKQKEKVTEIYGKLWIMSLEEIYPLS